MMLMHLSRISARCLITPRRLFTSASHIRNHAEIEKLRSKLSEANDLYYGSGTSQLSDKEYDDLSSKLVKLTGVDDMLGDTKVHISHRAKPHLSPMLSLRNIFSQVELLRFDDSIRRSLAKLHNVPNIQDILDSPINYCFELKYDGVAICLTYEYGKLVRAVTRGDGSRGEDVTISVSKLMKNIPQELNVPELCNDIIEIRGELLIECSEFTADVATKYSTPRNLVAGLLKYYQDYEEDAPGIKVDRKIPYVRFIAYGLILPNDLNKKEDLTLEIPFLNSQYDRILMLKKLNFDTDAHILRTNLPRKTTTTTTEILSSSSSSNSTIIALDDEIKKWENKKALLLDGLSDTDGVVIKLDDLRLSRALGHTAKYPRAAVAYKFPSKAVSTIVEKIETHIGRTGRATPVAVVKPAKLGGVWVSRASLHNFTNVQNLKVRPGCIVQIERRGEVIPHIVKVLNDSNNTEFQLDPIFKKCPCERKVDLSFEEIYAFCSAIDCQSKLIGRLSYFTSRNALNIQSLGEKTVEELVKMKFICNFMDILNWKERTPNLWLLIEKNNKLGWGEKRVSNIQDQINIIMNELSIDYKDSKIIPNIYIRLLISMGIPGVGSTVSITLLEYYRGLDALSNTTEEELSSIPGIGSITASRIVKYLPELKEFLQTLYREQNIRKLQLLPYIQDTSSISSSNMQRFDGETVVFTGSLGDGVTRLMAEEFVRKHGGNTSSTLTKKCTILVLGENPSQNNYKSKKMLNAEKWNVSIMSSEEFISIMEKK